MYILCLLFDIWTPLAAKQGVVLQYSTPQAPPPPPQKKGARVIGMPVL